MGEKPYRFDGSGTFHMADMPFKANVEEKQQKTELLSRMARHRAELASLQEKLYAQGMEGLVVAIQALDAAGKDSIVKHVFNCMNPEAVNVYSFKAPNAEEAAHDYLWRIVRQLPQRGQIAVFNRSHYEDILPVYIHQLYQHFNMPKRVIEDKDFFEKRFAQIEHFEQYLYENGYRVVKVFLNVSRDEQKKRFLERMDRPEKHWKFASSDLDDRARWDDYHALYEQIIRKTGKPYAPWYVLPADSKWLTRCQMTRLLLDVLRDMNPQYPPLPEDELQAIPACRDRLMRDVP